MLDQRRARAATKWALAGIIALFGAAAATQAQTGEIRRYVIVNGDSMSGSWDTNDPANRGKGIDGLRTRFGEHFAWFRQDSREYVVTDAAVLADLDKAMEPQKKVNRKQAEVNGQQTRVNGMQAKVNAHQGVVNALQAEVNRRQEIANQVQAAVDRGDNGELARKLEAELQDLRGKKPEANQSNVNREQSRVNEEQAGVNAEQSKVNALQQKVNEEQTRASAEVARRMQDVLGSAVQRGVAQQLE